MLKRGLGVRRDFLKIEDIIAFLYSNGNTLVENREVKINDAGQRERTITERKKKHP